MPDSLRLAVPPPNRWPRSVPLRVFRGPQGGRYEMLLRRGKPDELIDGIDGALLVDLGDDLRIPQVIRQTWDPVVVVAGERPVVRPRYGEP